MGGFMQKPVILLIDDEIGYAKVIQDALQPYGIEVLIATNATEALLLYQQVNPSMILLDVMMPEIDGLTLLRWLREHSDQRRIPIHVVSAKSTPADQKAALKAGADGFLAKPFTFEELRNLILAHLPVSETGQTPSHPGNGH
jgi:two-component system OmpR family response regulator